jgi:hypothetical protein
MKDGNSKKHFSHTIRAMVQNRIQNRSRWSAKGIMGQNTITINLKVIHTKRKKKHSFQRQNETTVSDSLGGCAHGHKHPHMHHLLSSFHALVVPPQKAHVNVSRDAQNHHKHCIVCNEPP